MPCARHPISSTPSPARRADRELARSKGKIITSFPEQDFLARVEAAEFLESARVHGHYYGTLREPIRANLRRTASMS